MEKSSSKTRLVFLIVSLILISNGFYDVSAQDVRWMRVGELQSFFADYGAEPERDAIFANNYFTWPTKYGDNQYLTRSKAMWFGSKNFYDPVEKKEKSVKVVGAGPRYDPVNQPQMVFPEPIRLIGKYNHPLVVVDQKIGTNNTLYDLLDEVDENLPCDRMIIVKFNTSMGISVTKKMLAFTQQNHDDYFIYDIVIKNTGIYNRAGDVYEQTLKDFWVYFNYRYSYAGVTSSGYGSTWGAFSSEWGRTATYYDFGKGFGRESDIRGFYGFYAPSSDRSGITYAQDWGCPNQLVDGLLGSATYTGVVTIFASKSANDWVNDDPNQPRTTAYIAVDNNPQLIMNATVSQYDELFMGERYRVMTEGHLPQSHMESVGDQYISNWTSQHPDRDGAGGTSMGQGFGPYTLAPGDSIHIVFAEGANGISWEKCREVGVNWYAYYKGTGTPDLSDKYPPNYTGPRNSYTDYTRAWVETGRDSILQTLRNALANYTSGYDIPQAPPAPDNFSVQSGGNRIRLEWSNNAESSPHFNGYVIYRSEGNVKDYRTRYSKILECDRSNVVNAFDDMTASRGFNYYYYIQSKDDGTQNDVRPGEPLYSSPFLTLTSVPATLQRPAITGPPEAPAADTTRWKLMTSRGEWDSLTTYIPYDAVSYNNSNYVWIDTTTTAVRRAKAPDIDKTHWQLTTLKGEWVSGAAYNANDVVFYNGENYVTPFSISGGSMLELVRVVPNPYDIRGRFFQFGDQSQYDRIAFYGLPPVCKLKIFTERGDLIWEKDHTLGTGDELWNSTTSSGQIIASGIYVLYVEAPDGRSVFRKFVVIR
jgi:hypothetical protein